MSTDQRPPTSEPVAQTAPRMARMMLLWQALCGLVLFSTANGDAWLLDASDSLALCLARDSVAQPYHIVDTPTQFAIEWTVTFAIEGDAFVVQDPPGQARAIRSRIVMMT